MAQRKKRSKFRDKITPYVDDLGVIASGYGATQLPFHYRDTIGDVKKLYLKNISSLGKKRIRIVDNPQMIFKFGGPDEVHLSTKPLLKKDQLNKIRNRVQYKFRKNIKRSNFRFFRELKRDVSALNPRISKDIPKELVRLNRRSLRKVTLRNLRSALPALGLTFLSIPLAKAYQAQYAKKRKFKKEFKRGVKRGIVSPIYGATVGIPLSEAFDKHPYLRKSKSIRSLEGRLSQKYGQGVGFYKGSSGFTKEERKKLEKSLEEYRRVRSNRKKK